MLVDLHFNSHNNLMNTDQNIVDRFLVNVNMHPQNVEMKNTVLHMTKEMEQGLKGQPSSLPMIPTYIEVDSRIPKKTSVVALDAGGTHLRAALISFDNAGLPNIQDFSTQPMPGTQGKKIGREEFFHSLAAVVKPLISRAHGIGFCFSYPTEIFPNKDGRLIHWSKEIQAPEVEGCTMGEDLTAALHEQNIIHTPKIILLNDTVATLLTGLASQLNRSWSGYVGFILGTGTNTCYLESNTAIKKIASLDPDKKQIINCETGNYAYPNRGTADINLGENTAKPGTYFLEKMLSGRYFGALVTQCVALAGQNDFFSPVLLNALSNIGTFSTKDADGYCHNPSKTHNNTLTQTMCKYGNRSEQRRLWFLIDALLERAARLSAANLATSVLKGTHTNDPLEPTCLTIDGTTYYRYHRFQSRVENHLRPFLIEENHFYESFKVENAPLIGAAVAALTN